MQWITTVNQVSSAEFDNKLVRLLYIVVTICLLIG